MVILFLPETSLVNCCHITSIDDIFSANTRLYGYTLESEVVYNAKLAPSHHLGWGFMLIIKVIKHIGFYCYIFRNHRFPAGRASCLKTMML